MQYSAAARRPLVVAHDSRDVTRFVATLHWSRYSCRSQLQGAQLQLQGDMANLMGSFVDASVNNMQLALHERPLMIIHWCANINRHGNKLGTSW